MCDLCLAAEHATFGITEARVGRGMPWAAPLVTMVQQRALLELLLTAEPITAQRAREIGFVNHVVPAAELLPRCFAMAEKIAANAPLTVRAARELVYLSTEMGRSAAQRAASICSRAATSAKTRRRVRGPSARNESPVEGTMNRWLLGSLRTSRPRHHAVDGC